MGIIKFSQSSFRALPVTAVRYVRSLRYAFAEEMIVPTPIYASPQIIMLFQNMYCSPLPGQTKNRKEEIRKASIYNLSNLSTRMVVNNIYPWTFSSSYTFAYIIFESTEPRVQKLYDDLRSMNMTSIQDFQYIINYKICEKEFEFADENDENRGSLTRKEIINYRKLLSGKGAMEELKAMFTYPRGLLDIEQCTGKLENMKLSFKLLEIPNYSVNKIPINSIPYNLTVHETLPTEAESQIIIDGQAGADILFNFYQPGENREGIILRGRKTHLKESLKKDPSQRKLEERSISECFEIGFSSPELSILNIYNEFYAQIIFLFSRYFSNDGQHSGTLVTWMSVTQDKINNLPRQSQSLYQHDNETEPMQIEPYEVEEEQEEEESEEREAIVEPPEETEYEQIGVSLKRHSLEQKTKLGRPKKRRRERKPTFLENSLILVKYENCPLLPAFIEKREKSKYKVYMFNENGLSMASTLLDKAYLQTYSEKDMNESVKCINDILI